MLLQRLWLSNTQLSGTIDAQYNFPMLSDVDLSRTALSGDLAMICNWRSVNNLLLANTAVSGELRAQPPAGCTGVPLTDIKVLDLSGTRVSGAISQLSDVVGDAFALTSLNLARTAVSGDLGELLATPWASASEFLDLSDTAVSGTLNAVGLATWSSLAHLSLRGSRVSGTLTELFSAWRALTTLDLAQSRVSGVLMPAFSAWTSLATLSLSSTAMSGELLANFSSWTQLVRLNIDNTRISGRIDSLVSALGTPVVIASNASGSLCFDGGAAAAFVASWALQGARVADECPAELLERLDITEFSHCDESVADSDAFFNGTYCTRKDRFAGFGNGLSCPSWSSYATGGLAALDVDASWLGYWGCRCPEGAFWGYADSASELPLVAIEDERALMREYATFGANMSVLARRTCVPCPPHVVCNPLALMAAPHQLLGSRYPLPLPLRGGDEEPRARRHFVYATLLPCLHPAVCNRAPEVSAATWAEWVALNAGGVTGGPSFAEYLCRDGHDPASLMCSRCVSGYWLDGFLCERCLPGYAGLVAVGLVGCVALLVVYVAQRALVSVASVDAPIAAALRGSFEEGDDGSGGGDSANQRAGPARAPKSTPAQTVATTLWYFQVSAALSISAQVGGRALRGCAGRLVWAACAICTCSSR